MGINQEEEHVAVYRGPPRALHSRPLGIAAQTPATCAQVGGDAVVITAKRVKHVGSGMPHFVYP
eukprot:5249793-Pyramimonas_sp.AAC.1